jgi:phage shock protein PspC (stress-responsive transcriptional regulator)
MAQVDARQRAPRLERSRRDRWFAGVAGGIAHHIGVQSTIVRIAFVVLTFAAGFGLVVYVLTWLLAPLEAEDDGAEAPPRRIHLPSPGRALGIGFVIVGVLALLWLAGLWFQGNFVWPVVLAAIGFAVLWARG